MIAAMEWSAIWCFEPAEPGIAELKVLRKRRWRNLRGSIQQQRQRAPEQEQDHHTVVICIIRSALMLDSWMPLTLFTRSSRSQ